MKNPLKVYFTRGGELDRKEYLIWNVIILQLVGGFLMISLLEGIKEAYVELIYKGVGVSYYLLYLSIILSVLFLIAYGNTTAKRVRNMGTSDRLTFWAFVPYINFVVSAYLLFSKNGEGLRALGRYIKTYLKQPWWNTKNKFF